MHMTKTNWSKDQVANFRAAPNERALYDRARRFIYGWVDDLPGFIIKNVVAYLNEQPARPVSVHPKVWQACELLDTYFDSPRWDEVLDPFSFDIGNGAYCVLGQLGGRKIPGDGRARWEARNYTAGKNVLWSWLDKNPGLAQRFGEKYKEILHVFDTDFGTQHSRTSQNVMWMLAITWRRRDRKSRGTDSR
jgi:hypothetical protein